MRSARLVIENKRAKDKNIVKSPRTIFNYHFLKYIPQNSFREDIKSEIWILRWNLSLLQPLEKMTELKMQWRNCYARYVGTYFTDHIGSIHVFTSFAIPV